jgi:hypothetical protein
MLHINPEIVILNVNACMLGCMLGRAGCSRLACGETSPSFTATEHNHTCGEHELGNDPRRAGAPRRPGVRGRPRAFSIGDSVFSVFAWPRLFAYRYR